MDALKEWIKYMDFINGQQLQLDNYGANKAL